MSLYRTHARGVIAKNILQRTPKNIHRRVQAKIQNQRTQKGCNTVQKSALSEHHKTTGHDSAG